MKMARIIAFAALFQLAAWAQQDTDAVLEISGDIPHQHTYTAQEWKQLKHTPVTATNAHEKKTATYNGVPLQELLKEAGIPTGENLRGKALTTCIIVSASDGYQVVFSLAELDEGIGNVQVLVADSEDGKPLGDKAGPLRLVVPSDKRPARWVRMVKSIKVVAAP